MRDDLDRLERAHRTMIAGATHEEAKPENSKDTRALEQSYLARGQAMRIEELQRAVVALAAMTDEPPSGESRIESGAVVTLRDDDETKVIFMAPYGGGIALCDGAVQVVTPSSPLGRALLGRSEGDACELTLGGRKREIEVVSIA